MHRDQSDLFHNFVQNTLEVMQKQWCIRNIDFHQNCSVSITKFNVLDINNACFCSRSNQQVARGGRGGYDYIILQTRLLTK